MRHLDLSDHYIVPGFIDVHVHGVEGLDTLQGGDAIAAMAQRLPRFGVTAFCPTTIACAPAALRAMLRSSAGRQDQPRPAVCARAAGASRKQLHQSRIQGRAAARLPALRTRRAQRRREGEFTGAEILAEIAAAGPTSAS